MAVTWLDINKMTSNTAPSPLVAMGSHNISGDRAWYLFDGGTTTTRVYFMNDSSWAGIDFGEKKTVNTIKTVRNLQTLKGDKYKNTFDIEVSTDGTNWTLLETVSTQTLTSTTASTTTEWHTIQTPFTLTETRYIRIIRDVLEKPDGTTIKNNSSNGFHEIYFGYEPPNYKATIELYDANTLAKITTSVSATLLKNGVTNKYLTFANGSLLVENLDNTSTWSIETTSNSNYNALSATRFTPTINNPIVKLYLKPTVNKKFNFKDESGVALSGKSVKLKIYKDGSTTALIDTTVTSSTYTTTTLYDGSYTYEIECEGYNKVKGNLVYDSSEININFTLYVPINKTLILSNGEYKKWNEKKESIEEVKDITPVMNGSFSEIGEVTASSTYTGRDVWKIFDNSTSTVWSNNTNENPSWVQFKFNEPKIFNKIGIASIEISQEYRPSVGLKDFKIKASNDGENFITLYEGVYPNTIDLKEYSFSNNDEFEYIRVEITSNHFNNYPNYFFVSTLKIYAKTIIQKGEKERFSTHQLSEIQTEGMDSLSPLLDRRVETLEPIKFDKSEILLNNGKLFSKTIDLNKYMDIRKISYSDNNSNSISFIDGYMSNSKKVTIKEDFTEVSNKGAIWTTFLDFPMKKNTGVYKFKVQLKLGEGLIGVSASLDKAYVGINDGDNIHLRNEGLLRNTRLDDYIQTRMDFGYNLGKDFYIKIDTDDLSIYFSHNDVDFIKAPYPLSFLIGDIYYLMIGRNSSDDETVWLIYDDFNKNNSTSILKSNNKIHSLKSNELTVLPNDDVENLIEYGLTNIANFNNIQINKNYILSKNESGNTDGLWEQEINRKPLSIKFE